MSRRLAPCQTMRREISILTAHRCVGWTYRNTTQPLAWNADDSKFKFKSRSRDDLSFRPGRLIAEIMDFVLLPGRLQRFDRAVFSRNCPTHRRQTHDSAFRRLLSVREMDFVWCLRRVNMSWLEIDFLEMALKLEAFRAFENVWFDDDDFKAIVWSAFRLDVDCLSKQTERWRFVSILNDIDCGEWWFYGWNEFLIATDKCIDKRIKQFDGFISWHSSWMGF